MIEISSHGNEEIVRALAGFSEVQAIHSTNGQWDCIVEFAVQTLPDMDRFLKRLRLIDGISNSETSLYLATMRSNRSGRSVPR